MYLTVFITILGTGFLPKFILKRSWTGILQDTLAKYSARETKKWILFLSPAPHVSSNIKVTHKSDVAVSSEIP